MVLDQSLLKISNKDAKEAFVHGLTGSGMLEIVVITTIPTIMALLAAIVDQPQASHRMRRRLQPLCYMFEFVVLVLPQILQLTGFDPYRMLLYSLLVVVLVFLFLMVALPVGSNSVGQKVKDGVHTMNPTLRDAVSVHRGTVMLVTCLSILAVDFHAFPRKYGKTETYGTSVMDAGVGSIVFCSAFVQGIRDTSYGGGGRGSGGTRPRQGPSVSREIRRSAVLILLGLGRPIVTSIMGYQLHVGEYGTHWNFFLTLAVLRLILACTPANSNPLKIGSFVLIGHQFLLSAGDLSEYVNQEGRSGSLLSQNKEGLISMVGYTALHFLAVWMGRLYARWANRELHDDSYTSRKKQLAFVSSLWVLYMMLTLSIEPVSRRSCNAAYVLWMLANNAQAISLNWFAFSMAKKYLPQCHAGVPLLLRSINKGMLYVFLLANVATGVINATVDTLQVSDANARLILGSYMAFLSLFSVIFFY